MQKWRSHLSIQESRKAQLLLTSKCALAHHLSRSEAKDLSIKKGNHSMSKSCRPLTQLLAVTLSAAKSSETHWRVANFMKVQLSPQWTTIIQTLIRAKESAFYLSTRTLSHRCEETIGRSIILLILLTPSAQIIGQMSGKVATRERLLWARVELA